MDQRIIDLYDEYTHVPLPRRMFLDRLTRLAGGAAATAALLPLLEGSGAEAAIIAADDARLRAEHVDYPGAAGTVRGYLASPRSSGDRPAVVVIHENRGLNPHIEDVARRLAVEGFLALAPDALSPVGGTPKDQDKARQLIRSLDRGQTLANYVAAVGYMKGHRGSNGKVGCVGFCWGGGMVNQVAVNMPDLDAAVVFYGRSPKPADARRIMSPMLLHYAGLDKRINAGVPGYEAALKRHSKRHSLHMYDGANHAFHNDTRAARYDKSAADLAWRRTIAFFKQHLGV